MKTFNLFIALMLLGLLLALSVGGTLAQGPVPGGLVLWNKLGSESEVLHSEIGPSFSTRPGVIYVAGRYGGALATTGGENGGGGYLTMSPDDFFPADKTRGTVEVWIQKRIARFIPFQTPLVGIFGWQPYAYFDPTEGYTAIMAYWSDGYTGGGGMQFQIRDSNGDDHAANDLGWDDVPVGEWVHMAFVWDLAGIQGSSDKMRIYRDGAVVAANADDILGIMSQTDEVRILGHHAYHRFGQPTAYLDNIMVWSYAKTDFSDRFNEAPTLMVSIDIKPGSDPNSINLKSKGVVPVAVLTTDDFDASDVDPGTVEFAGALPERWTMEDVDSDGDTDLLLHFKTQELDLNKDSTQATLTGQTHGGLQIKGTDTVKIVPKGK